MSLANVDERVCLGVVVDDLHDDLDAVLIDVVDGRQVGNETRGHGSIGREFFVDLLLEGVAIGEVE